MLIHLRENDAPPLACCTPSTQHRARSRAQLDNEASRPAPQATQEPRP
nr:MAG TPA: hypothetical protein [Caudoviricetes sp.]